MQNGPEAKSFDSLSQNQINGYSNNVSNMIPALDKYQQSVESNKRFEAKRLNPEEISNVNSNLSSARNELRQETSQLGELL